MPMSPANWRFTAIVVFSLAVIPSFAIDIQLKAPAMGEREAVVIDPKGEDRVDIRIDVPICDIQEMWMPSWLVPRQDRKWTLRDVSAPQADLPYVAYFNTSGCNAFSIGSASFAWDTQILSRMNQETGAWEVTITVVAGPEGNLKPFAVTLDRRRIDWIDVFSDWRTSLNLPKGNYPDAAWKPVFCSWYAVHAALSQEWVDQTAEIAAPLGFKTFILDDGWSYDEAKRVNPVTIKTWYQDVGRWDAFSPKKFPDFNAHREHMRTLGLNYLVWVSPYFVGTRSELYTNGDFDKKGAVAVEGNVLADPTDRAFMDAVDDQLVRLMKDSDLDGLKIDFLNAIPPSVKNPRGAASLAYVERLMKKLRAVKPEGLFEFRQPYATPRMAHLATQFRAGDVPFEWLANFLCLAQIRVTMGDGIPIHADPIFWSATESVDNINRHFIAAMVGVPMLSMDLVKMPETERKIVQRWLGFYTAHVEKFQRTGSWRVDYKSGGVAAVSAVLDDEAFIIVNDADFVPRLARRFAGRKLVVANLTFETIDLGENREVPAGEAAVLDWQLKPE